MPASTPQAREQKLEQTISSIIKRFGDGAIIKMGEESHLNVSVTPTGSLSLGVGGMPRGRVIEIYGLEASGKTTICQHIVAEAQRMGGLCALVDMEHALDPGYAPRCGADVEDLYIAQPGTGAVNTMENSIRAAASLPAPDQHGPPARGAEAPSE
jgi:recombination protein RecA